MRVLVVNAGSSSLKLRLLGPGDELAAERDLAPDDGDALAAALARRARAGRGRPPRRARRRALPRRRARRRRASWRRWASSPTSRRCTSPRPLAGIAAVGARAARRARGRLLRHGVPRDAARGGRDLRAAPRVARALRRCGASASTASRTPTRRGARPRRRAVVTCHLGAGASLAAVRDGVCVDTTMGFTPLEGLVMATRSGSVDPGLVLWLLRHGARRAMPSSRGSIARAASAAWPATPTCAPSSRATTTTPGWRSTSTCTACGRRSRRWRPPSAASTRSSSPAAWASTRRRSARGRRRGSASSGVALDAEANASATADAEIGAPGAAGAHARRHRARGPRGRPPGARGARALAATVGSRTLFGEHHDGVRPPRHDDGAMPRRERDRP